MSVIGVWGNFVLRDWEYCGVRCNLSDELQGSSLPGSAGCAVLGIAGCT